MIILKYTKIGNGLTKTLNPLSGLYGAIDANGTPVIKPLYSEFHPFRGERATVVKDGQYCEIDRYGNEYRDKADYSETVDGIEVMMLAKADYCVACFNEGCEYCNFMGFLPMNYDFDID